jgi:hypothetical protein
MTSTRRARRGLTRLAVAVAVGGIAAVLPVASRTALAATPLFDFPCSSGGSTTGDFNNDGKPDLVVGAPGDDLEQTEVDGSVVRGVTDAGSISVVYSDSTGPNPRLEVSPNTRKYFSQNTPGMNENSEKDDTFGFALASGDFDGVGGDDLAVGVPNENGVGAVHIIYSSPVLNTATAVLNDTIGLSTGVPGSSQFNAVINQNSPGVEGGAEAGDGFGYAVAAGDVNADGFDDLVIGVPREDLGTISDAGIVQVIYGSFGKGLDPEGTTPDQVFEQGPGQIRAPEVGRAEPSDFFGASLAIGQFDQGGALDIAVGSPGEDLKTVPDGGAVRVLYSRGLAGPSTAESDFFHQQTLNVDGIGEAGDRFGCALAGGDFDGDGDDDLAVGVPGESIGTDVAAGVLQIFYNSGLLTGIAVDPGTPSPAQTSWHVDQMFSEDDGGIPGVSKPNDRFAASLAVANFNGNGPEDLAVGVPTETLFDNEKAGSVRVVYGSAGFGLTDDGGGAFAQSGAPLLTDDCPAFGILDDIDALGDLLGRCLIGPPDYSPVLMIEETGDQFGASIAAADFDGDGFGDFAAGAPGEDLGLFVNWLLEEEVTVPDDVLVNIGVPLPLDVDEVDDAGALNLVFGPFPTPTDPPERMDVLYRTGNSPFNPLRSGIHQLVPFLQNNQIGVTTDPSYSGVLEGDGFGSDQS